jgi:oligoendopeptidase F
MKGTDIGIDVRKVCEALVLSCAISGGAANAADARAQWDPSDLYATPQAWSDSYQRTRTAVASLDRHKGTLGTSAETMCTALVAISDARRELSRLFGCAAMLSDEDLRVAPNAKRRQQATWLYR